MGYRIVITGSRYGRVDFVKKMDALVAERGSPELVVIGDATGVDTQAWGWCVDRKMPFVRIEIDERLGSPRMFRSRNEKMVARARTGDVCVGFPDADSRGTWHCMNVARKAGLEVLER